MADQIIWSFGPDEGKILKLRLIFPRLSALPLLLHVNKIYFFNALLKTLLFIIVTYTAIVINVQFKTNPKSAKLKILLLVFNFKTHGWSHNKWNCLSN